MYGSIYSLMLTTILIGSIKSDLKSICVNGRRPIWTFQPTAYKFSSACPTPGQSCGYKTGKCSQEHLCCPRTLKMRLGARRLFDPATNIEFNRTGEDFKNIYRLYELGLVSTEMSSYNDHTRWLFFDETLRDLFEMPNANFWIPMINCMQNFGIAFVFVPLNASSITTHMISAMTILTRKPNSINAIYICYMATRKEHRRRGLATRLLQQIVTRALVERSNGVDRITMHVNTLNTVALELYERCGWRCTEFFPKYLDPDPHYASNHAYALTLHLDHVKNVTGLCRDSNAVDIQLINDKQSIEHCHRTPIRFGDV